MPNSPKVSAGFLLCLVAGVIVCAIGIGTSRSIKSGEMNCPLNSTVNDDQSVKPTNNTLAVCLAEAEIASQAKVASRSALSHGIVLGGVAIMIAGVGFSVMSNGDGPSGPRPPMPLQQQLPGQPYPRPPQP